MVRNLWMTNFLKLIVLLLMVQLKYDTMRITVLDLKL